MKKSDNGTSHGSFGPLAIPTPMNKVRTNPKTQARVTIQEIIFNILMS